VPAGPAALPWDSLGVEGPMARNVPDLALLLDAMAGQSDLDPLSFATETGLFSRAAASRARPARIAFSRDLGVTPVDPEVAAICEAAARRFEEIGVVVEEACPDFSGTEEVFQTLRALNFAASKQPLLDKHRDLLKPEVIWNIDKGLSLTVEEVTRAERERARIMQSAVAFFADYDLLLSPATIVPAFGAEERYCAECDGQVFDNYIQWLAIAYAITITSCPALSLPCGFTKSGLPVGLQMVVRPRGEAEVIAAAAALDDLLGFCARTPIDPREG
jgi:amidase